MAPKSIASYQKAIECNHNLNDYWAEGNCNVGIAEIYLFDLKNVDKGILEFGFSEDGEEINVNKVSEALRVAGINLNEFLTGSRGLDDIFMELASKWDSLDMVQ